jgi:small-conductance mechanosensitive channel
MDSIRSALFTAERWLDWLPNWVVSTVIIVLAVAVAYSLHKSARRLVRHLLATRYPYVFSVFTQMRGVTQLGVIIFALLIAISIAPLSDDVQAWFARVLLIAIICLIGWAAMTALNIGADLYLLRFRLDVEDNLMARKHNTQVRVLLRTADALVLIVTLGAALMTFESVRQYGVSLFASAGVAGIVAGLAARPVLSNLFAGVQLAMTQPIRIDDAVIVENEWGSIEEITSTYVVVRLWDWRRMIVPLSYFIEKPFQNWTRDSSALIGSAFFYLDYRAPVDAIREKLGEIVKRSKDWNGQVVNLQVTDTKTNVIELRALMSANSAGQAFDLRCEVREKMVEFLQNEHPHALPVQRSITELSSGPTELADATRDGPKAKPRRSASR